MNLSEAFTLTQLANYENKLALDGVKKINIVQQMCK